MVSSALFVNTKSGTYAPNSGCNCIHKLLFFCQTAFENFKRLENYKKNSISTDLELIL
jgi:hypothetical protein